MPFGGPFISHKEVFSRRSTLEEITEILSGLDPIESLALLCQINADLRLVKREKGAYGSLQSEIAGGMLDDATISQLKKKFPTVHCGDRPLFHTTQILNVMRLAASYCSGSEKPLTLETARYKLGSACLMMNDLFLTEEEKIAISTGEEDSRRSALLTQMLGPFEIVNTQAITHLMYRSRVMYRILLRDERIITRIRKDCGGFDFEKQFLETANISLTTWLFLIFLTYAYLIHYKRAV
jgi:hypothetical protein